MRIMASIILAYLPMCMGIDNGIGLTPPMGWRSWNAYGGNIDQEIMVTIMTKMAEKKWNGTSIADLGYLNVGLDDNWQACGTGYLGSFHDQDGNPIINTTRFTSMKAMTSYGHSLNLKVGWYMNNCICDEHQFKDPSYIAKHMQQSAAAVAEAGFDGVKLDGCGQFLNLTWWGSLLNQTGRPIMIENCHWGGTVPGQTTGDAPCSGTTMPSNCPYNFFRSSTDIRASWSSIFFNLQSTVAYQGNPPLSRPGTWAYPDMLEVGRMATHEEDRTHFGAWCIVSSPLILGYDVSDDTVTEKVWDIIANKEAIAVNQAWAGHPGRLVVNTTSSTGEQGVSYQVWGKVLSGTSQAVFAFNNEPTVAITAEIDFTQFGFSATDSVAVRDIWNHKPLGTFVGSMSAGSIAAHDSRFLTLTLSS
eukprot:TRINITY_DN1204_c14_g1_i1.p1 TRINITY_DN1204_c14_g1~~TRINITY_DN1204_c14_g1_i1.p1  ORF type:complete len:423 (+),score=82.68 TRINITY_DN1204_c14_g1_i1:23-1270(+)